jgi:hypothetical protein
MDVATVLEPLSRYPTQRCPDWMALGIMSASLGSNADTLITPQHFVNIGLLFTAYAKVVSLDIPVAPRSYVLFVHRKTRWWLCVNCQGY